jgi:hypothetical protein
MISMKGMLVGLVFAVVGTIVFAIYTLRALSPGPFFQTGPRTGVDVRLIQMMMLRSPAYWLMIFLLLAAGCAIIYFWHRPTV